MTLSEAQAAAGNLRTALLDHGVRAVSIELQQGASSSSWGVAPFKRGLGHHIASRPSQGNNPGLALVKRGRTDLAGPLCNGYGGYDLIARIITMGWANHPGTGGPWAVPGWGTVPVNNGRPYIFGWEFEGGFEPYTDEMHDFMARCGAGTLDWLGTLPGNPGPAPLECWGEHKTWAGARKPDRIGYTTASGRDRIAAVRNQEDDMTPAQEKLLAEVHSMVTGRYLPDDRNMGDVLRDVHSTLLTPYDYQGHDKNPDDNTGHGLAVRREVTALRGEVADLRKAITGVVELPAPPEGLAGGTLAIDYDRLAKAINDDADRRARDGDAATGPTS